MGQGREGLNIPVVRLAAAGFDPNAMLSLMLSVRSALHQDIAMGMPRTTALLPALARPFVTAGAACEQVVPMEFVTLGRSLGAFLCPSQVRRL